MVAHTCNSSTQEAEGGGWRVPGLPRLHSNTLLQKKKKKGRKEGRKAETIKFWSKIQANSFF
jgi:hypothetical protein